MLSFFSEVFSNFQPKKPGLTMLSILTKFNIRNWFLVQELFILINCVTKIYMGWNRVI